MKKVMIISAFIGAISLSACGQKLDASKVPAAVKSAFAKQYPGVAVKWEKEDGKYEASFKQNGNSMSALFEANGTMIESEIDIKVADLPSPVLAYVKDHFKGKSIREGAKITKADGTVTFEAEVAGKDVIFDANGKYIETK